MDSQHSHGTRTPLLGKLPASAVYLGLAAGATAASAALARLIYDGGPAIRTAVVTGVVVMGAAAILLLLEAVAAAAVSVQVTRSGLRVRPTLLPLTGMQIPATAIQDVRLSESAARALHSLGWWRSGRCTDVALRSGPALVVTLTSGREITISASDPARLRAKLRPAE